MKFWPHSVPGLLLHLAVSSRGSQEWLLHRFQLWARPLGQHRDSTGQTLAAQGILQGTPTLPDFPQWSCSVPQGLLHPCCSLCPRYQTLFWPHSWPWSPVVTHTALSAFCHLPSHLCQSFSYPKCSYLQTACPRHIYIYISLSPLNITEVIKNIPLSDFINMPGVRIPANPFTAVLCCHDLPCQLPSPLSKFHGSQQLRSKAHRSEVQAQRSSHELKSASTCGKPGVVTFINILWKRCFCCCLLSSNSFLLHQSSHFY